VSRGGFAKHIRRAAASFNAEIGAVDKTIGVGKSHIASAGQRAAPLQAILSGSDSHWLTDFTGDPNWLTTMFFAAPATELAAVHSRESCTTWRRYVPNKANDIRSTQIRAILVIVRCLRSRCSDTTMIAGVGVRCHATRECVVCSPDPASYWYTDSGGLKRNRDAAYKWSALENYGRLQIFRRVADLPYRYDLL
jgi:hypothetical protein